MSSLPKHDGLGQTDHSERTQPWDRKRMKPCVCFIFFSWSVWPKHPACVQPRMTTGSDMDQTAQTPGMATWAPRPSATQTEVKLYHLGPALEPRRGGRQAAVPILRERWEVCHSQPFTPKLPFLTSAWVLMLPKHKDRKRTTPNLGSLQHGSPVPPPRLVLPLTPPPPPPALSWCSLRFLSSPLFCAVMVLPEIAPIHPALQ